MISCLARVAPTSVELALDLELAGVRRGPDRPIADRCAGPDRAEPGRKHRLARWATPPVNMFGGR